MVRSQGVQMTSELTIGRLADEAGVNVETIGQELGVDEGQVTSDGRCSFVQFECLGSCDTAPMIMVDDDYHENLTPERVRQIVRELK